MKQQLPEIIISVIIIPLLWEGIHMHLYLGPSSYGDKGPFFYKQT